MVNKNQAPHPLYPIYEELENIDLNEFPTLTAFLNDGAEWWLEHWHWGREYLQYIGRNKSENTYTKFRIEVERFLLWAFLFQRQPIDQMKKGDILMYADFFWSPPKSWIQTQQNDKFICLCGKLVANPKWAPFCFQKRRNDVSKPEKKAYRPSQQSMISMFTTLIAFYRHLMEEGYLLGNPVQIAKRDCRHIIRDAQVKRVKRLSEMQWKFMLDVAKRMADENPVYERNLFLIAALKSLFLRISELSERKHWIPEMRHFWEDTEGNWWLKVYGKGRKVRDITVPDSFLLYLKRYRCSRGLTDLPSYKDNLPIIEKLRGYGGMSSRHLGRLVQQVLDRAYDEMINDGNKQQACQFKAVSSHWLRHTGASMEVERGRPLKDLSEDLGHASMATTDAIYVHSEDKKRADSGRKRDV